MSYANTIRINANGYYQFGEALPATFADPSSYALNTTNWPGTVWDFSGVPMGVSTGGDYSRVYPGALITPRHILNAHHIIRTSGTVALRTNAGDIITRTITDTSGVIGTDINIQTLDSAVTDCAIYSLPTAESMTALNNSGITLWLFNASHQILTRLLSTVEGTCFHSADSTAGELTDGSGCPVFITRGTDLVLVGTNYTTTRCSNPSANLAAIETYVDEVSETITTISVDPTTWVQPLAAAF
jgi:hypothetical protein